MNIKDLTGEVFDRLTVIDYYGKLGDQHAWNCKCICGELKIVRGAHLRTGFVKSCGCLKMELLLERSTKHGHSSSTKVSSEYMIWAQIVQRCTNPDHPRYKDYGGRGITICNEWLDFRNFIRDVGERPSKDHSLDRRDNESGYNKDNFRWATREEQGSNTRTNVWIIWERQRKTMAQWQRYWGLTHNEFRKLLVKHNILLK